MAALKSLSDEALSRRLRQHGITSPVTPSTRDVLIKRLNHVQASHRKATGGGRARRAATTSRLNTLSSDEDEDEVDSSPGRARGGSTQQDSGGGDQWAARRRHGAGADGASVLTAASDTSSSSSTRRPRVSRAGSAAWRGRSCEDFDTGSDSDPNDNDYGGGAGEGAPSVSSRLWGASSDPLRDSVPPAPSSPAGRWHGHNNSARRQAPRPRSARAYLENGREWVDAGGGGETEAAPVLDTVVSRADAPTQLANGRHHLAGSAAECQPEEESTWHYKVPLLLLVLLAVFFGVVAMLYVNIRMPLLPTLCSVPAMVARLWVPSPATRPLPLPAPPLQTATLPPTENRFPVCSTRLKDECLSVQAMALVQPVLGQLEEVVVPALHHQAGRHQCGEAPTKHLSSPALQDLLRQHNAAAASWSEVEAAEVVESLGHLVEWNPHWGLEAVWGKGGGPLLGLAVASQPTYILCHITTAIYSFLYLIVGLVTVIITAWLAFSCARYYKWKAEEEKQQMYELVEQILEVLSGLGGASGKDFVAVNHVRDSLIGPRDRRSKQHLWDRAVAFINNNESRVRREVQAVGGEDCEVWRWASGMPHSHHSSASSPGVDGGGRGGRPPPKVWQGPAFNLSPHNVPSVSPTSCLKIRNMFDCDVEFGESWPTRIQDSILEKCDGISIVHVVVDRTSREGCVYLKCSTQEDAGRAFRALHGFWYDGNLVTVKFLRDERYHQRFPSARHATLPLRPSNNKRLSLQQVNTGISSPSRQVWHSTWPSGCQTTNNANTDASASP